MTEKNCRACRHSYMEPSGPARLICGESGDVFNLYVTTPVGNEIPKSGCGEKRPKFEQHPGRNPDGSLKSANA